MFSKKLKGKPFALFMDQLTVHRAKLVNPVYKELKITRIFNKTGSPDYNPIESVFSQVKRDYCRNRLQSLANDQAFFIAENIRKSFKKVTREMC